MRFVLECRSFGFLVVIWPFYDIVTDKTHAPCIRWRMGKYRNFAKA